MTRSVITASVMILAVIAYAEEGFHKVKAPGYPDMPKIEGTEFTVHQADRAQPPRVIPAPYSGSAPIPSDAEVLFDGTHLDNFAKTEWILKDGVVIAMKGGLASKKAYGDMHLHVEWRAPNPPRGGPMSMGNSGIFIMGKYELQVFDSYTCEIYADGSAAAIYGQTPPMFNVCRAPGEWQTYDIYFTAPAFEGEKLTKPAYITVLHNGVFVHVNTEIKGPTRHKQAKPYESHDARRPFYLQGHGNPVEYRKIWVRDLNR